MNLRNKIIAEILTFILLDIHTVFCFMMFSVLTNAEVKSAIIKSTPLFIFSYIIIFFIFYINITRKLYTEKPYIRLGVLIMFLLSRLFYFGFSTVVHLY